MNVEDVLIGTLTDKFNFPVMRQGSLLEDEPYPDNFFTFWNSDSNSEKYYDNRENMIVYYFSVYFYSNNPEAIYQIMREAIAALKAVGFLISGDGFDVSSDEKTHDGRGVNCQYVKRVN